MSLPMSHYNLLRANANPHLNSANQRSSVLLVPPGSCLELWIFNKWTLREWGTKFIATQSELPDTVIRNVLSRIGYCGSFANPNKTAWHSKIGARCHGQFQPDGTIHAS